MRLIGVVLLLAVGCGGDVKTVPLLDGSYDVSVIRSGADGLPNMSKRFEADAHIDRAGAAVGGCPLIFKSYCFAVDEDEDGRMTFEVTEPDPTCGTYTRTLEIYGVSPGVLKGTDRITGAVVVGDDTYCDVDIRDKLSGVWVEPPQNMP